MILIISWTWGPSAVAGSPPDDAAIHQSIQRYIAIKTSVPAGSIDIDVQEGIVNLSGSVSNILQKDQVQRIAESLRGVRSVIDNTGVRPVMRDDDAIARDVRAALPSLSPDRFADITVNVNDGVVTLSGRADSWVLSRWATRKAMSVKGVSRIVNRIDVSPRLHRDDKTIKKDVEQRLAADLYVDAATIEVAVENARVSLVGTVRTLAQKRRCAADAWIAGVAAVDDRQLFVNWQATMPTQRSSPYVHRSDKVILQSVRDALRLDPRINPTIPDISVVNGAVSLSGAVDTLYAKQAAEADALNTTGVWKVNNQIQLRYRAFPPDDEVERLIRDVFRRDAELDALDIGVSVVDHHLKLGGSVKSMSQKIRAENIASQIEGVLTIDNGIRVAANAQDTSDGDTLAAIQDELFWSPYVDGDQIDVSVTNGRAVLEGRASDRFAARMAVINAFEGGARSVRAQLEVQDGGSYAENFAKKPALSTPDAVWWPPH